MRMKSASVNMGLIVGFRPNTTIRHELEVGDRMLMICRAEPRQKKLGLHYSHEQRVRERRRERMREGVREQGSLEQSGK